MKQLLTSNIRKVFEAAQHCQLTISPEGLCITPVFETEPLRCIQDRFLGFYIVPDTINSILRSINFAVASEMAYNNRLLAPAVIMSYTSSYHLLGAYLSLNGRHWIERPRFKDERIVRRKNMFVHNYTRAERNKPIIGILSEHNKWVFQNRKQSHEAKWHELNHVFSHANTSIPASLQYLFEYLHPPCSNANTLSELCHYRENVKQHIKDKLLDFLQEIPEIRHEAIYRGMGGDPNVYDALVNRDCFDENGLSILAGNLINYFNLFIEEVLADILSLIESLSFDEESIVKISLISKTDPYDDPLLHMIQDATIKERCTKLYQFVNFSGKPPRG